MTAITLRPVPEHEKKTISDLEKLSVSELEADLATGIGTMGPGVSPVQAARQWLRAHSDQIHRRVCEEGKWCEFAKSHRRSEFIEIVAALSDLLATLAGSIPVYTLSALLFRQGLDTYCSCE
jgi:hypothetical protein